MAPPAPASPPQRLTDLAQISRPSQGILVNAFAVLLMAGASLGATWVVTALARWQPWLHWPAVAVLAAAALFLLFVAADTLRTAAHRQDTATSTIRGAAQGVVELRGRVHAIPGRELTSEFLNAACIAYSGQVLGLSPDAMDKTLMEAKGRRSFVLRDGTGEVFVPASFVDEGLSVFATKPMDERPAVLPRSIRTGDFASFNIKETLVPIDIAVQVNGVFTTLGADECYLDAHRARSTVCADDSLETDWRAYADSALAAAGPGMPAPRLNAILPSDQFERVSVIDPADDPSNQTGTAALLLVLALPPAVVALDMAGIIDAPALLRSLMARWH